MPNGGPKKEVGKSFSELGTSYHSYHATYLLKFNRQNRRTEKTKIKIERTN
jgi:hypothetical protein